MELLSSHVCAAAATPLHRLAVARSFSSTQQRLATPALKLSAQTKLHAQFREGFDIEIINVTDLRNNKADQTEQPQSEEPQSESLPYYAGLSEEEIREALLFEQGGDEDEGPRLEEAARMAEGEEGGAGFERPGPIPITRGNGEAIASMLSMFKGLLDRPFGTGANVAATGSAVIERVQEEIENLKQEVGDEVDEQLVFEIIRVTKLLEMDMKLISAAQKESTLLERLDSARKHCQEAILLANAL